LFRSPLGVELGDGGIGDGDCGGKGYVTKTKKRTEEWDSQH